MLALKNLRAGYGDIEVLHGVNLEVNTGEVVALLGANAAGKTTLINCVSGLISAVEGQILFAGKDITKLPAHERASIGIIQVCEGRNLFPDMTVEENLELGAYSVRARRYLKETLDSVYQLLPILKERRKALAGSLSGGQQQMVALGRGLMSRPKILMLDEPSLGLAPVIVETVFQAIKRIAETGSTILLVEQNVVKALEIASRAYVLENGNIVMSGKASDLAKDDGLRRAYMGI